MNSLFCLAGTHSFCFTYSTVFILAQEFSQFYPSDSLPHPTGGERVSSCGVLNCQPGLDHDIWEGIVLFFFNRELCLNSFLSYLSTPYRLDPSNRNGTK